MFKEFYAYTANFLPLALGAVGSNNPFTDVEVRIDPDSDFEFVKTIHTATSNAFRLKYRDDTNGRQLMKASQDARAISGTSLNLAQQANEIFSATLTPALVGANTTAEQLFTVTGLVAGQTIVSVNKPTAQAGLGIVGWRVSAVNQIGITFSNNTGVGITPTAAEVYLIAVTGGNYLTGQNINGYTGSFVPFVWPRPYIIAGATTFTVSAADNSGVANTIRMAFHGSKIRAGKAPWDRKYRAMIPYVYPLNVQGTVPGTVVIAASDTVAFSVPTDKDGSFLCMKLVGQRTGQALITIKDGGRDRQWMDSAMDFDNMVGNAMFPNILASPRYCEKGAVISGSIQDLSAASNTCEVDFVGIKVYE